MAKYIIKGYFGTDAVKAAARAQEGDFWINTAALPTGSGTHDVKICNGTADATQWPEATKSFYNRNAFVDLETNDLYIWIDNAPYLQGTEPGANYETKWDLDGEHWYSTGVSKGFICLHGETVEGRAPNIASGIDDFGEYKIHGIRRHPWSGLISVNVTGEGGEMNGIYADNMKYLNLMSNEECKFTIEAYQSPEVFDECDGTLNILNGLGFYEQPRRKFDFGFFTQLRNDKGEDTIKIGTSVLPLGQLHIFYNCTAAPSDRQFQTINDSPEAMTMSWDVSTEPIHFSVLSRTSGIATMDCRTSHIVIDTRRLAQAEQPTVAARMLQVMNKIWDDRDTVQYCWQHMPSVFMGTLIPYTAPAPQPNPIPNP